MADYGGKIEKTFLNMKERNKNEEIEFLLQELNRIFKQETGIPLENSMKASDYINGKNDFEEVSDRFLRDHWPSLVKSKGRDYKIDEETDKKKKQTNTLNSKTINKLNLIAKSIGYKNWEDFCLKYKLDTEKEFTGMDYFKFSSLLEGETVYIGWYPQRYCKLKYLGEYSFEVIESCRMRSNVGRIIETSGFRLAPTSDHYFFPEVIIEPLYEYQEELWNAIENFNKETCPQEILL
ncbi:hypothetical protein [Bacteroides caecicola]|nr:hypothetical protein [Bacteroides caecicola]